MDEETVAENDHGRQLIDPIANFAIGAPGLCQFDQPKRCPRFPSGTEVGFADARIASTIYGQDPGRAAVLLPDARAFGFGLFGSVGFDLAGMQVAIVTSHEQGLMVADKYNHLTASRFGFALECAKLHDDLARIGTAIGKIAELDENRVAGLPLAGLIDEAGPGDHGFKCIVITMEVARRHDARQFGFTCRARLNASRHAAGDPKREQAGKCDGLGRAQETLGGKGQTHGASTSSMESFRMSGVSS